MTTAPAPALTDRFVTPADTGIVRWAPTDPAPLPAAYLAAVDDYLRRVDEGGPTGRARLRQLHPNPPCHTGGAGPLSGCPCTVGA